MLKNKIALLVASTLALPVFAQSNVQVYGVADTYVQVGKWMGDDVMGLGDVGNLAGNRLGFRGKEDLGNGLKAVFVLEEGYDLGNGKSAFMTAADSTGGGSGSNIFTRQAYVGLQGSFGQVSLGRQYAPGFYVWDYDGAQAAFLSPMAQMSTFFGMTITPVSPARWNNSVVYSGDFQSIGVKAIYSMNNRETDQAGANKISHGDDDKYGVSLTYNNGPIRLGAIYHGVKFKNNAAPNDKTQDEWLLGGSYDFEFATVAASYQKASDVNGFNNLDEDLFQVGFYVPFMGNNKFNFSYIRGSIDRPNGGTENPTGFTAILSHAFSKRTSVYTGYVYLDYDNLMWGDVANYRLAAGMNGHVAGEKIKESSLFYFGLSHQF